ncbi:translation initiation factor IF-2 [candidate division KSB3 bacterium]|uniref:Translation initiation factor IF-2 n=1 Tax=candidate division KSB3 bacterium TaxID=2044937 RepID=A0A2G6KJM0_9BACT|nr:MAG: translation initiation factor IF-2 [candidate division KSB3 bacterium]
MSSNRIYDLARKLNIPNRDIINFLKTRGVEVKSHMSSVDDATVALIIRTLGKKESVAPKKEGSMTKERVSKDNNSIEKKVVSRAYIPPRRRKKRRHEPVAGKTVESQNTTVKRTAPQGVAGQSASAKVDAVSPSAVPEKKKGSAPSRPSIESKTRSRKSQVKPHGIDEKISASVADTKKRTSGEAKTVPSKKQDRKPVEKEISGTADRKRPEKGKTPAPSTKVSPGPSKQRKRQFGFDDEKSQSTRRPVTKRPVKQPPEGEKGETEDASKRKVGRHVRRGEAQRQKKREKLAQAGSEAQKPTEKPTGKGTTKRPPHKKERVTPRKKEGEKQNGDDLQKLESRPVKRGKPRTFKRPGAKTMTKTAAKAAARAAAKAAAPPPEVIEPPKRFEIPEVIMVKELAEKMHMPPAKVIQHLMTMGFMPNVNQVLDTQAAISIAEHFGFEVRAVTAEEEADLLEEAVDESKLKPRPPVVTIMGHVDHGKTTLLDAIRESKITETEFGGITQHIGAYAVNVNDQDIVFLDTPGHEAFTAMRARGAQVTDEVILVVAADDGIMPQTIEAIDHARAAEVPIVVAINKIDVPGANPDRVMQELTKYGLTPEAWGGETICVNVSAKQHTNLDELLEMILLQAEILELKADPERRAKGVIVEALLDKGRGPVATVLVQGGTLRVGDPFVVGNHYGKVRAMLDDRGKRVHETGPSRPVEVLGLTGVPVAGDAFVVVGSDREARQISESRQEQQQAIEFSKASRITLEELHHHIKEGETQELRIVIKADVHGSVEALTDALERLSTELVRLQVIHGGVGAINESDVMLASASNAIVLGFNVRPVAKAEEMAEKEQIDVRLYTVIYQAIDDVKKAMEGLLKPRYDEVFGGQANVQAVFNLPKSGKVAGCRVTEGKFTRNSIVRVLRDKKELFKGNIASLRRVKDDVKEVLTGFECGIRLEGFNDIQEGDVLQAYVLEKVSMTLEEAVNARKNQ